MTYPNVLLGLAQALLLLAVAPLFARCQPRAARADA
jgi:hypothetical protein